MKKILVVLLAIAMLMSMFTLAAFADDSDKNVVIWTTEEEHLVDHYTNALKEKFPDYNITIENLSSSTMAAKVMEEKENCSADILWSAEYGYLEKAADYFVELTDFDFSIFLDDIVPASHKYLPALRNAGCVILSPDTLAKYNLPEPTSYQDLLDSQYQGLISMPNPASSGTGYMFLLQLVNEWGEDEAFEYFEKFSDNVLQYTSSGMGPVNALIAGEAAIGLGMTSQTVTEINEGLNLKVTFFEEGSPFSMYGNALLSKSADKQAAVEVFNYMSSVLVKDTNSMFYPEQILKDFVPEIENYPKNIKYGNMSNDTLEMKEHLLSRWEY